MTVSAGGPLVVLGDVLLDVDLLGEVTRQCPDAPEAPVLDVTEERRRPGGAGLAALLAAADGVPVRLVTALADDADAEVLRGLLEPHVELVAGRALGTTAVKCRLRAHGRSISRVDRGNGTAGPGEPWLAEALCDAAAVLVSDYGRGLAADPVLRAALAGLVDEMPVLWDPHPRGDAPVRGVALATPNLDEAVHAARRPGRPRVDDGGRARVLAAAQAARRLRTRWDAGGVVVTLGALGALLDRPGAGGGATRLVPAPSVRVTDPCGAGDRFAASAAAALRAGLDVGAAVETAVHDAARFVEAGGAAAVTRPTTQPTQPTAGVPDGRTSVLERRRA